MKKSHLIWSGVIAATLMSASAVFAANPAIVEKAVTGSWFLQATSGGSFVNGTLTGTQAGGAATSKLNIASFGPGRNTNRYNGQALVRCYGQQPKAKNLFGPEYFAQISCNGTGNLWRASISIF